MQEAFALRGQGWVPIIFDETGLKERAMLLGAGTWYKGRALPLAMYAYQNPKIKKSLWAYREGLLSVLSEGLSEADRARFLLIADRGYAASAFFRRLLKAHLNFAIRVPRRVLFSMAHQQPRVGNRSRGPGACSSNKTVASQFCIDERWRLC